MYFRGKYWFLSNFYPCNITVDGLTYHCAEAAFQAQKAANKSDAVRFCDLTGKDAKQLGRQIQAVDGWGDNRISAMRKVLACKFDQHPELADKLMQVKDVLVEDNDWGDRFWGVSRGSGANHLGRLLAEERSRQLSMSAGHVQHYEATSDDIVFLDVETPNNRNDRVCEVAFLRMRPDGKFVDGMTSLVDPECSFDSINTSIHGIRKCDVVGAPTFGKLWQPIQKRFLFEGAQVAGHNIGFDMAALEKSAAAYGAGFPSVSTVNTVTAARELLPGLANYRLDTVADALGVELSCHHQAMDDTKAASDIFFQLQNVAGCKLGFSVREPHGYAVEPAWSCVRAQVSEYERQPVEQLSFEF